MRQPPVRHDFIADTIIKEESKHGINLMFPFNPL